jgi:hypothetical protein
VNHTDRKANRMSIKKSIPRRSDPTIRRLKGHAGPMRLARCGTIFLDAAPEVARRIRKLVELIREPNGNMTNDADAIAKALEGYVLSQKPERRGNASAARRRHSACRPALTPKIAEKGRQSWA